MENDPLIQLRRLPLPLKGFFFTDEPRILCEEVCMLYGLSEEVIPAVTKPLAGLFVGELPLSEYPKLIADAARIPADVAYGVAYEVNQRIFLRFPEYFTDAAVLDVEWGAKKSVPVVSLEEAKRMVFELEPWLLEKDGEAEEERVLIAASREKLALVPALGKYPRLGEQQVTKERIKVGGHPDPVRPTLSNWIRVYRDELGVGYHEPMERGKFLFDSVNGKRLSAEDRERLNLVLRSIEENVPLDIDSAKPEIVFPEAEPVRSASSARNPIMSAPRPAVPARAPEPSRPVAAAPLPSRFVPPTTPVAAVPAPPRPAAPLPDWEYPSVPMAVPFERRPVPETPVPPVAPVAPVAVAPPLPPKAPPAPKRQPPTFAPAPPENLPVSGNLSFSSGHSLPIESERQGNMSIRKQGTPTVSHGPIVFRETPSSPVGPEPIAYRPVAPTIASDPIRPIAAVPDREYPSVPMAVLFERRPVPEIQTPPVTPVTEDPAPPVIRSVPHATNPFHIHPAGFDRGDTGHVVNLREG